MEEHVEGAAASSAKAEKEAEGVAAECGDTSAAQPDASEENNAQFLTLRVSPPAHPGTMPRRADGRREEETHIVKQRGQHR